MKVMISLMALSTISAILALVILSAYPLVLTMPPLNSNPATAYAQELPTFDLVSLHYAWGKASTIKTRLMVDAEIRNTNTKTLTITKAALDLKANAIGIGKAKSKGSVVIMPGQAGILPLEVSIMQGLLGQCLASHINNGNTTELRVVGTMSGMLGEEKTVLAVDYSKTLTFDPLEFMKLSGAIDLSPFPLQLKSLRATGWGTVTDVSAVVNFEAVIRNTLSSPINWSAIGGQVGVTPQSKPGRYLREITLARSEIGDITLQPGDNKINFQVILNLDPTSVGKIIGYHLKNSEASILLVKLYGGGKLFSELPESVRETLFGTHADSPLLKFLGTRALWVGGEYTTHIVDYLNEHWTQPF